MTPYGIFDMDIWRVPPPPKPGIRAMTAIRYPAIHSPFLPAPNTSPFSPPAIILSLTDQITPSEARRFCT